MSLLKSTFASFLISLFLVNFSYAQEPTSLDILKGIAQTPEIAKFFEGTFNHLGIIIDESGEKITLHHEGDKITIEEGLDPNKVDFVLPLILKDIGNVVKFSSDGKFDEEEATHVAKVFFTPFTRETMKNPVMSENRKRKAAGIEDLIHVQLLFPDGSVAASHTLIYAAKQWVVLDELVGVPRRTFKMKAGPALEYQVKVFHAIEMDSKKEWIKFVKWYKTWRNEHSTKS